MNDRLLLDSHWSTRIRYDGAPPTDHPEPVVGPVVMPGSYRKDSRYRLSVYWHDLDGRIFEMDMEDRRKER